MIANVNCLFDNANDDYKYDSDAQLGDKITELSGRINAAAYCFLKMVAAFDRRKGWCDGCIKSCSHWLNWKCGITRTTAREKLRVAHCLERLPHTNKAFEAG
ncbi:MAG: hypothetical protein HRT35_13390 [Algicola sp.]|nr:hypothetical protein [Algicola sp.]